MATMEEDYQRDQEQIREAYALKAAIKNYVTKYHSGNQWIKAEAFNLIAQCDRDAEHKQAIWN